MCLDAALWCERFEKGQPGAEIPSNDDFHMSWHWRQVASVEWTLPSWPRHNPVTSGFEPSDCSLNVKRRKAILTFMIDDYMNFVRRRGQSGLHDVHAL